VRLTLIVVVAAFCFAQKPKQDNSCHLGSPHNCHCPRMVARHNETIDMAAVTLSCPAPSAGHSAAALAKQDEFRECLRAHGVKSECEIVARYDPKHPEENCKSACRTDHCACHDGPACTHFAYDIDHPPQDGEVGRTASPEVP
jgi:hypothetical protein